MNDMNEKEKAAYKKGAQNFTGKVISLADWFEIFPDREELKGCKRYFRLMKRLYTKNIVIMEHIGGALDGSKARVLCIKPEKGLENIQENHIFSARIENEKLIIEK